MRRKILLIFYLFLFSLFVYSCDVNIKNLKKDIEILCGDLFEGRLSGSEGGKRTEEYLIKRFKGLGLEPLKNKYFHEFLFTAKVSIEGENYLKFKGEDEVIELSIEKDFIPSSFSSDCELKDCGVVFCSFGIKSSEPKRDDYADVDVKDKVVIVLRDGPSGDDPKSPFAPFYSPRYKASVAKEHHAKAIILVDLAERKDELPKMRSGVVAGSSSIAVVSMKKGFLKKILEIEGKKVENISDIKDLSSFEFNKVKISMKINLRREKERARNIVGILKAKEISDEYIVIGAHHDHLGRGIEGSLSSNWGEIHRGADDNASGVAGLLELARVLKKEGVLKRNILFIAFGGEELGGLGSTSFVNEEIINPSKIVAMINLDMIGRLREKLIVDGVGTAKEWESIINEIGEKELNLSFKEGGFGASDHSAFYSKKIPVLFFFTGAHEDYHLPSDNPSKINYEGEVKVIEFVKKVILKLANEKLMLSYLETKSPRGGRASFKVYVGTVPDFTYEGKGFKIMSVKSGSPAEMAGLMANDIIISINGKKIDDIYDYAYSLSEYKPNDEVEVIVIRNGEEKKLKLTFGERDKVE